MRPVQPVAITAGKFNDGTKHNIIPDKVALGLTMHTTSAKKPNQVLDSIKRISCGLGIAGKTACIRRSIVPNPRPPSPLASKR